MRMVYNSVAVPLASAEHDGDTIFYLGENNGDFTYGHYYRCTGINGVYSWKDLTQDPSLEGVANGIREINKNRTVQMFVGTKDEILNTEHGENELIIPEDMDTGDELAEILEEKGGTFGDFVIPRFDENGVLRIGDIIIPQKRLIWTGDVKLSNDRATVCTDNCLGKTIELEYYALDPSFKNARKYTYRSNKIVVINEGNDDGQITPIASIVVPFYDVPTDLLYFTLYITPNGELTADTDNNGTIFITAIYEIIE